MKTVDQCDFKGKKALVRVDFNVPLDKDFKITDDKRMRAALPTINKILKDGGSVILMSHLGRPKGGPEDKYSLKHILTDLSAMVGVEVKFAADCIGEEAEKAREQLRPGQEDQQHGKDRQPDEIADFHCGLAASRDSAASVTCPTMAPSRRTGSAGRPDHSSSA